jgi:6-pyruvoyltetrahydropterin/6-carboxytetrahydropterin synthase
MITITRRYHFSASHRLHSHLLTASENAELYGKCNNPFGHGHDYVLEVTASGEVDPFTGLILPIAKLDRFVNEKVLELFAWRNINLDVPQFANLVPTTENIALVISDLLQEHWTAYLGHTRARLERVHIQETERNSFEVLLHAPENKRTHPHQLESVIAHA